MRVLSFVLCLHRRHLDNETVLFDTHEHQHSAIMRTRTYLGLTRLPGKSRKTHGVTFSCHENLSAECRQRRSCAITHHGTRRPHIHHGILKCRDDLTSISVLHHKITFSSKLLLALRVFYFFRKQHHFTGFCRFISSLFFLSPLHPPYPPLQAQDVYSFRGVPSCIPRQEQSENTPICSLSSTFGGIFYPLVFAPAGRCGRHQFYNYHGCL